MFITTFINTVYVLNPFSSGSSSLKNTGNLYCFPSWMQSLLPLFILLTSSLISTIFPVHTIGSCSEVFLTEMEDFLTAGEGTVGRISVRPRV